MQKRIESVVVILIGAGLVALALITQLFTRAPAFEEMTDDFRPLMSNASIATMQSDLKGMQAMTTEIQTQMLPDVAAALQMEPEALNTYLAENFPATATGMEQLPGITEEFLGMNAALAAQQENFEAADAIPTKSLPVTVFPWGLAAVGALAMLVGVFMWRTAHIGSYIALALGILMVGAAFLMSWPSKTSKADELNLAFRDVMTTQQVEGAQGALTVVSEMGTEMQQELLPGLAAQMGMTDTEMSAYITGNYPAVGAMFESMDAVQARFDGMVGTMSTNIDNYDTIKPLKMEPINWIYLAAGLLIAITGGLALLTPFAVERRHPVVTAH
jgi:hypothetical protein